MLQESNAKAYAVLAILIDSHLSPDVLDIYAYTNCREHGFIVKMRGKNRVCTFSNERNHGDEIIVCCGEASDFEDTGIAKDSAYDNRRIFYVPRYAEAASCVACFLETGMTE